MLLFSLLLLLYTCNIFFVATVLLFSIMANVFPIEPPRMLVSCTQHKGQLPVTDLMNFQKTSDGRVEVISDPKNFAAVFSVILGG